jgi:hypothetical protein
MFTEADLRKAVAAGLLSEAQLGNILAYLSQADGAPAQATAKFDLTHVLWYGGALIVMAAMGLFSTAAFGVMGGWALFATGAIYAIALWLAGRRLWRRNLRNPGGLLIAAAVSMVPLMIFGVQDALGLWTYAQGQPGDYRDFFSYVHGSWIYMEAGTVLAAIVALRIYKVPFLLLVGGIAMWFMSMDIAMWFTASATDFHDIETRRKVSIVFGLCMIAVAWGIDIKRRSGPDLAFWLHIFGAATFWGALTASPDSTELTRFIYALINLLLIGVALFIDRRVYAVFGAIGIAAYLGYLAYDVFNDMILFSFALSGIGPAVIALGLWLNRHYATLSSAIDAGIPQAMHALRPKRHWN